MKWFLIGFMALLITVNVSAEFISLQSTIDMQQVVNDTSTEANITITNSGDEPAYDVIVEPMSNQGLASGEISLGTINPNQTVVGTLEISIPSDAKPGKYAMGVLIRYSDVQNYPFTFVTPLHLFYQKPVQSNVVGLLNEVELVGEEKKTLTLEIQNREDKEREVFVKLYTPNQIAVSGKEQTVTLLPSSKTNVEFVVSSLGALPGGNFYVFAVIDYDDDAIHYSVVSANGKILTSKPKAMMDSMTPLIVVVVVVLVLVLIYLQLRQDKPVKPAAKKK